MNSIVPLFLTYKLPLKCYVLILIPMVYSQGTISSYNMNPLHIFYSTPSLIWYIEHYWWCVWRHIYQANNNRKRQELRHSVTIWGQRSGSPLTQVMAWCLAASSYKIKQCWLFIKCVHMCAILQKVFMNIIRNRSLQITLPNCYRISQGPLS